jgi:hypothetical protein
MVNTGFRLAPYVAAMACFLAGFAPLRAHSETDFNTVLRTYELTMPKVKAWEQASLAAAQALKGREDLDEAGDEDAGADADSIEDLAASLDAIPEIHRAAQEARLSTQELATIGLVLFQSIAMEQVMQLNPNAEVPDNMNPANLKFVQAHKAELEKSVQAVQAASGGE